MIAAPGVTRFVGAGGMEAARAVSEEMAEIYLERNMQLQIPGWDFQGACLGLDIRRVVETGITPLINTGIAHKEAGIGQIGAGTVRAPLAWIMGVGWSDANLAGSLIGQKLAINEFVAYLSFSPYLQTGGTLEVKTIAIISFALCGFANFGSIGVVVGAFSAISPKRAPEIAQLGLRALAAATLSNLMSATIAGFFIGLA